MKAIVISKPGGPEVLQYRDVPTPEPGENEVRVAVRAAGLNRMDILQRRGQYPLPPGYPTEIPGVEFAGVVDKLGPGAVGFELGQRVFGLTVGGAYAQFVVIHSGLLMKMPENMSFEEAAGIPEAYVTAYDAMVLQANLSQGETSLISAVGSGVGSAGVQVARVFGGRCIGTARTKSKLEAAQALGLDVGIETADGKFAAQVLEATDGKGVDVILELVGGDYLREDLKCLATKGRITLVGLLAGSKTELNLPDLMHKRATVRGTTLRVRPLEERIDLMQHFSQSVLPHFSGCKLQAVSEKVFPLRDAAEAHIFMEDGKNFGKVILRVEEE